MAAAAIPESSHIVPPNMMEFKPYSFQVKQEVMDPSYQTQITGQQTIHNSQADNTQTPIVEKVKRKYTRKPKAGVESQANNKPVVKSEPGTQVSEESQQKITDHMPVQKRKRDRFKGTTEEEVLTRVLPDHVRPDLDILIVGINPGLTAAYVQHHYAGPGNHFWKCLYLSGMIPEPMNALQDAELMNHGIGFTNIVARTTRGSADLTRKEIAEGGVILKEKMLKFLPKIALFNGKGIYEVFSGSKNFYFGLQPEPFPGCPNTVVFVNPSSSARCTQLPRAVDKVPFYEALKKVRGHIRQYGSIDGIDRSTVTFPDFKLVTAPQKNKPEQVKVEPAEPTDPDQPQPKQTKKTQPKKPRKPRQTKPKKSEQAPALVKSEPGLQYSAPNSSQPFNNVQYANATATTQYNNTAQFNANNAPPYSTNNATPFTNNNATQHTATNGTPFTTNNGTPFSSHNAVSYSNSIQHNTGNLPQPAHQQQISHYGQINANHLQNAAGQTLPNIQTLPNGQLMPEMFIKKEVTNDPSQDHDLAQALSQAWQGQQSLLQQHFAKQVADTIHNPQIKQEQDWAGYPGMNNITQYNPINCYWNYLHPNPAATNYQTTTSALIPMFNQKPLNAVPHSATIPVTCIPISGVQTTGVQSTAPQTSRYQPPAATSNPQMYKSPQEASSPAMSTQSNLTQASLDSLPKADASMTVANWLQGVAASVTATE